MIVVRVLGREVLALGRPDDDDTDETVDTTAGQFELAEQLEDDAYIRTARGRPPIVRLGSAHAQSFGFAPTVNSRGQHHAQSGAPVRSQSAISPQKRKEALGTERQRKQRKRGFQQLR